MKTLLRVIFSPIIGYVVLCLFVSRANIENKSISFWFDDVAKHEFGL